MDKKEPTNGDESPINRVKNLEAQDKAKAKAPKLPPAVPGSAPAAMLAQWKQELERLRLVELDFIAKLEEVRNRKNFIAGAVAAFNDLSSSMVAKEE